MFYLFLFFFFSSRRRHTRFKCDWSSDVCSSDLKDDEFDPARQAHYVLQSEALHRGLATESLDEPPLNAGAEIADAMERPRSASERRRRAYILFKEDDELSAARLRGAVRALRRIH